MSSEGIRIGIDTGGTFTDFALSRDAVFHTTKILTTHQAPELAIMQGLDDLMKATGCRPGDAELIIHGTTLATNAVIEHKGARVAMLTTEGFRDVLELGSESRFDQYDLGLTKPAPLVPRQLRFTISERLAADGSELLPPDLAAIEQVAEELKRHEIDSVAVCFLHSFTNPEHEERAAQALRKHLPGIYISLSSRVAPEIREYERFSTTVANAYIQPLIDSYLKRLQEGLKQAGFGCPLYMFVSNGGMVEVDVARQFPGLPAAPSLRAMSPVCTRRIAYYRSIWAALLRKSAWSTMRNRRRRPCSRWRGRIALNRAAACRPGYR